MKTKHTLRFAITAFALVFGLVLAGRDNGSGPGDGDKALHPGDLMTRTVSGKEIKFRYALKREMPFHKVKKVIRFRFAEIERWIDKKNKKGGSLLNRFAV